MKETPISILQKQIEFYKITIQKCQKHKIFLLTLSSYEEFIKVIDCLKLKITEFETAIQKLK